MLQKWSDLPDSERRAYLDALLAKACEYELMAADALDRYGASAYKTQINKKLADLVMQSALDAETN